MLPIAAAVLVGGTLVVLGVFGGDDDGSGGETDTTAAQVEEEIGAARASLTESLRDKREGISLRYPKTWRASTPGGERLLESRDRCLAIKLSAPATAERAERLRRDVIAALRRGFKPIQISPGEQGKQIGGIPTTQDVITIQAKQRRQVRVLVAVGTGKERAYLTEFLLRDPSCGESLIEGQLILSSIRYTG